MGASQFPNILPGAVAKSYPATAAFVQSTIATAPDSNGEVDTATSGAGFGVFATSGDAGDLAVVVTEGRALLTLGGTVAQNGSIVATTAGKGLAAGTSVLSRIRMAADSKQANQGVANDLVEVIIGVGGVTPAS
jgi:hypothetical protein